MLTSLTDRLTTLIAKVCRPVFVPAAHWLISDKRTRPTWHYEAAFAALILLIVALLTTPHPQSDLRGFIITWVSAMAVLGSFLHAKVGYRMSEVMEAKNMPEVSCYKYSGSYWIAKEILWFIVFLASGAYPAIVGNVIFILYPAWRKIYVEERARLRAPIPANEITINPTTSL